VAGIRACPGPSGGVEWNGPAFDPDSRTLYVGAVDWCYTFRVGPVPDKYVPGHLYMGTGLTGDPVREGHRLGDGARRDHRHHPLEVPRTEADSWPA